jgi:hypothetical protein
VRYSDKWNIYRGLGHFFGSGLAVAFLALFSPWGFFGLLLGPCIESYQALTDINWDWQDAMWDLLEHTAGGVIFGCLFYFVHG